MRRVEERWVDASIALSGAGGVEGDEKKKEGNEKGGLGRGGVCFGRVDDWKESAETRPEG